MRKEQDIEFLIFYSIKNKYINNMKFEFDKRTGSFMPKKENNKLFSLLQRPSRSCYIYIC